MPAPRLRKEMYYFDTGRRPSRLFGLRCGQLRGRRRRIAKNAGWYDRHGHKLGWGDLSADDLAKIMSGISRHEVFLVLGETDSYWHFTKFVTRGAKKFLRVHARERAPGARYILEHCSFVILHGAAYCVLRHEGAARYFRSGGMRFKVISQKVASALINDGVLPETRRLRSAA